MIELFVLNAAKNNDNKTDDEKKANNIAVAVTVLVYLIFWIWAIFRALRCSSTTPDSRALHLLFAVSSPLLYIIFSYTVTGLCK